MPTFHRSGKQEKYLSGDKNISTLNFDFLITVHVSNYKILSISG